LRVICRQGTDNCVYRRLTVDLNHDPRRPHTLFIHTPDKKSVRPPKRPCESWHRSSHPLTSLRYLPQCHLASRPLSPAKSTARSIRRRDEPLISHIHSMAGTLAPLGATLHPLASIFPSVGLHAMALTYPTCGLALSPTCGRWIVVVGSIPVLIDPAEAVALVGPVPAVPLVPLVPDPLAPLPLPVDALPLDFVLSLTSHTRSPRTSCPVASRFPSGEYARQRTARFDGPRISAGALNFGGGSSREEYWRWAM
jgi:hypothetical protein